MIDTPTEHDLQIGTNDSSPIYTLDRATGQFALEEGLGYLSPIPSRAQYEGLMQSFLR